RAAGPGQIPPFDIVAAPTELGLTSRQALFRCSINERFEVSIVLVPEGASIQQQNELENLRILIGLLRQLPPDQQAAALRQVKAFVADDDFLRAVAIGVDGGLPQHEPNQHISLAELIGTDLFALARRKAAEFDMQSPVVGDDAELQRMLAAI